MTSILGIIPARYASTRFPAKALALMKGKTMIERVYEQVAKAKSLAHIVVATDHALIFDHVKSFGGAAIMTSDQHPSGTDRCFEAFQKLGRAFDYVVNIQGDEPLIQPAQIEMLTSALDGQVEIATLVKVIDNEAVLFNPNTPKVLLDTANQAQYFSRQTIPFLRGIDQAEWLKHYTFYKHIGIYAYRSEVLEALTKLGPSSWEMAESLEQLRWLENGFKIKTVITPYDAMGIDTPEDLDNALQFLE